MLYFNQLVNNSASSTYVLILIDALYFYSFTHFYTLSIYYYILQTESSKVFLIDSRYRFIADFNGNDRIVSVSDEGRTLRINTIILTNGGSVL